MREAHERPLLIRVLGGMGLVGGALWAAIPLLAVVAFYSVETGLGQLDVLLRLGALFQFAGLSVIFMLGGVAGVHLRYRPSGRLGRIGTIVSAVGFVFLLPGSVVPSGRLPATISALVPLVFATGLTVVAIGSAILGVALRRCSGVPSGLALGYAGAMPAGVIVGGTVAIAGAGNIALVLGLMVPFGFAWVALGGYLVWNV